MPHRIAGLAHRPAFVVRDHVLISSEPDGLVQVLTRLRDDPTLTRSLLKRGS